MTHAEILALAAKGVIPKSMMDAWAKHHNGVDPVEESKKAMFTNRIAIGLVTLGCCMVFLFLIGFLMSFNMVVIDPQHDHFAPVIVGCLFGGIFVSVIGGLSYKEPLFGEELTKIADLFEMDPVALCKMAEADRKTNATNYLVWCAKQIVKLERLEKQIPGLGNNNRRWAEKNRFERVHKVFMHFGLADGDYGPYFIKAEVELDREEKEQRQAA